MPRLTNYIYLERHRFLERAWTDFKPIFSIIPATDQLNLHRYYQTTSTAGESELLECRHTMTADSPSLPSSASKSFHTIYRAFRQAFEYAQGDDLRFMQAVSTLSKPINGHAGVRVRGLVKADIDPEQVARAVIVLHQYLESPDQDSVA